MRRAVFALCVGIVVVSSLAAKDPPPDTPAAAFTRTRKLPAKVTLDLTELLRLSVADAQDLGAGLGLGKARPGAARSIFRQRFAIRLVTQIVRRLARAGGTTRLAVRTRTGQAVTELIVAYPWRNAGRAEPGGGGVVHG